MSDNINCRPRRREKAFGGESSDFSYLRGLGLDFAGTGKGSVDFPHDGWLGF